MRQETIYIKGEQNVEVQHPDVTLGDIVQFECSNPEVLPKIRTLKIMKFQEEKGQRCVISILKIMECIHKQYPAYDLQNVGEADIIVTYEKQKKENVVLHWLKVPAYDLQNVGEADIIVTYEKQKKENVVLHWLKVLSVVAITFAGAAFSIMTFNNDVDTTTLFGQIYELVMGSPTDGFTVLEFTYCVGLIVGILIFFNHFGGNKFDVDPTPLEVEMRLYENDIQTTLIENYSRKGQELDVGQTASSGVPRV